MRQETPETSCSTCYGTGTRVEVHRSRYELERVLSTYGADDVLFVEADANAAIQFAMHGRYVQLAFPLPDPQDARFTRTPTGKLRTGTARERAYDQAVRAHWRSMIVAVRGKLQSVESGISTFEQEFGRFLVPQLGAEKKRRFRMAPKTVNWLLGGSHTVAIALVAAFLVPASAVGAFALPTDVVGHLAAPFRSAVVDESPANDHAKGVALARGGWSPSRGDTGASSTEGARLLALRSSSPSGLDNRAGQEATPPAPPNEPDNALLPAEDVPASASPPPNPASSGPSAPADAGTSPPSDDGWSWTSPPPAAPPVDGSDSQQPSDAGDGLDTTPLGDPPPDGPSANASLPPDDSTPSQPSDAPPDPAEPPTPGDTPPGNGKGNGNGNGYGQGNGQGEGTGQGQGNGNGNGKGKGGA